MIFGSIHIYIYIYIIFPCQYRIFFLKQLIRQGNHNKPMVCTQGGVGEAQNSCSIGRLYCICNCLHVSVLEPGLEFLSQQSTTHAFWPIEIDRSCCQYSLGCSHTVSSLFRVGTRFLRCLASFWRVPERCRYRVAGGAQARARVPNPVASVERIDYMSV